MGSRPLDAGSLPRWLAAALILAAAPVLARGGEVLEDVEELARALAPAPAAGGGPAELAEPVAQVAGALHRVEVAAAAVKLDRETELFHVRLLTGDDERVVAAMKVTLGRSYLARTGEGYAFWIRRQDVTLHELELVEGRELARDIAILVPRDHARDLLNELVAVCEFRVVAGADGLAATQSVQSYPMSVTEPLDGRVTTHVLRVALQSLTLRSARSGQVYRRIDANPVAAAGAGSAAARF